GLDGERRGQEDDEKEGHGRAIVADRRAAVRQLGSEWERFSAAAAAVFAAGHFAGGASLARARVREPEWNFIDRAAGGVREDAADDAAFRSRRGSTAAATERRGPRQRRARRGGRRRPSR